MDEGAENRLASVKRYLEVERNWDFILTLPFPVTEAELEALNGCPNMRAVIHEGGAKPATRGREPGIDAEAAVWRLPRCKARNVVFAGPWWHISRQMIAESRRRGVRWITHHSWGRWIRSPLDILLAMKIARRIVRFPVVEAPDILAKARLNQLGRARAAALRKARGLVFRHPGVKRILLRLLPPSGWHRVLRRIAYPPPRPLTAGDFRALLRDAPAARDGVEKRVVLVCGSLQPGGAERQVVNTLLGLKERGLDDLHLLCDRLVPGHTERYDHYLPLVEGTGVAVRSLLDPKRPAPRARASLPPSLTRGAEILPLDLYSDVAALYLHLRDIRPEVVHAWLDWSNTRAGLAAVLAGVPRIVLSCRNLNPSNFALYQPHMDPAYLALAAQPNVIIVNNSQAGAADYASWLGLPESRFRVVYNGVALEGKRRASQREVAEARARLGIPEGRRVVGSAFRFCAEKRPLLWVECAAAIAGQSPDTSFLVYGEGPMRADMLARARTLGIGDRLHLPGITGDMVLGLSAMDALLLTSSGEGTPNVALEAQWLGLPVVATRAGGVAECIEEGMTGSIVASAEPNALAQRVLDYLNDPDLRIRCERNGNTFVRQRFGTARMIEETMGLYGYGPERAR